MNNKTKEILSKILKLQDIEYEIFQLEKQLLKVPEERDIQKKLFDKKTVELRIHEDKLSEYKTEDASLLKTLETLTAKLASLDEKEKLIKTQKEFESLDTERRHVTSELDEEQKKRKDMYIKITNLEKEVRDRTAEVENLENNIETLSANISGKVQDMEKKIAELREKEGPMSKGIPIDVLDKFQRIVRVKEGIGIVTLEGSICGGCYVSVPPQNQNFICSYLDVVYCPNCQRILCPVTLKEEVLS